MIATKAVDFRKGADGLAALVRDLMQTDPFDGAIYVFRAKRADRVKLLFWDGTGVVSIRQEAGRRRVPLAEDRERRDAFIGGATLRAARRIGLETRAPGSRRSGSAAAWLICGKLNQGQDRHNPRKALGFMVSS
jgi:transposase